METAVNLYDDRFVLRNEKAIYQWLRVILTKKLPLYLHSQAGGGILTSQLLLIDDARQAIYLDSAADKALNDRLAREGTLVAESFIDGVQVKFPIKQAELVLLHGKPAIKTGLPAALMRMEHREFHRVRTPLHTPLHCHIQAEHGDCIATTLSNLSSGGMGITLRETGHSQLTAGLEYHGRIVATNAEPIEVRFTVQRIWEEDMPDGRKVRKAGCRFIDLPLRAQSRIDQLIIKLQLEALSGTR
jgi:c-di-GMP-binding flagellar brake protein YcgR